DGVIERHRIDPSRIYLTGLSPGGNGTWWLAEAYPHKWAAIAPVSAGVHPDLQKVRHIPAWIFQGAKDRLVPVERTRSLVRQLQEAGADVRYTEVPDQGHLVQHDAWDSRELYDWF